MRKLPVGTFAERRVEAFLENNPELIEPGLRLIRRQYPLKLISPKAIGKIDLFCQGEDGADCAIELVSLPITAHDLAQCMVYYDILQGRAERYSKPTVRTYLIGPSLTLNFQHALHALGGGDRINLTVKLFVTRPGTSLDDEAWPVDLHEPETHMRMRI